MTKRGGARARGLAVELNALRMDANLTLRDVAAKVGLSISTLSRVENGARPVTPEDTAALLTVYGVIGPSRTRLMKLAREATQPDWWETDADALPKHLPTLIALEADARHIVHSAMLRVPGLLQTADYTRTIMLVDGLEQAEVDLRVATRLRRQAVLTKVRAPRYLAIIDEMALRRVNGSRAVMAGQMSRLVQAAELPNVDIRIVPFDRGVHPGLDSSFSLMRFAKSKPVLYFEHPGSSLFADAHSPIRLYQGIVGSLLRVALGSAESVKMLHRLAAEFGRE